MPEPFFDDFSTADSSKWQWDRLMQPPDGRIPIIAGTSSMRCMTCGHTWQMPNGTGLIPFEHDCLPIEIVIDDA